MSFRELTYKINGAIFEVHRTLGEGFLEKVYKNALLIELRNHGLQAESQVGPSWKSENISGPSRIGSSSG
jgi:GxxExxY protein